MAVENDGAFFPTETIISRRDRKHYRVPVRCPHWQLRSLISAEKNHIVYFPGGKGSHFVQRLNTRSRECETIKLLSFAPRCLVAENSWLCCGSENGDFVAMRLEDPGDGGERPPLLRCLRNEAGSGSGTSGSSPGEEAARAGTPAGAAAPATAETAGSPAADREAVRDDPDDSGSSRSTPQIDLDPQMPHGLGPSASSEELLTLIAQTQCTGTKPALAKSMKLAKERVNCITLWFPPTDIPADENAYTEPIAVLANNDRTVTLVSLQAFERSDRITPLETVTYPDLVNRAVISPDGRIMVAVLDDPFLYVHQRVELPPETPQKGEKEYRWELKQRLLLKSQKKGDDTDSRGSFAACFSRSGLHLAVGTQYGTISIFESALLTQSDIDPLLTTFPSSQPFSPEGAVRDMAFCPGPYDLLAWSEDRGHVGLADMRGNFAVRQIVNISSETGLEHVSVLDRHAIDPRIIQGRQIDLVNHPLTAAEMEILEAIQHDRRRRDRLSAQPVEILYPPVYRPRDAPPLPPALAEDRARREAIWRASTATNNDGDSSRPSPAADGRAGGGGSGSSGILAFSELRNRLRERERNAARDWREGPRVQAALRELRDQRARPDPNYENVLEILFARDAPSSDGNEADDTSLLVPLVNQVVNRWEESSIGSTLTPGVFESPPSPDNTAGLAWSQDGCTLYVGAANGIYEFKVNTFSRKFCPSVRMR